MGGRSAVRGFILQTMVTLLDALSEDNLQVSVEIEPNVESEKVDVLWYHRDGSKKAVQVKSSENQISKTDAEGWARELQTSFVASSYELILLGPCSQSLAKKNKFGLVEVPPPKNLDIEGLSYQLAHKLDIYMEHIELPPVSAIAREMLVDALGGRFLGYSTIGEKIERSDLERLIKDWIAAVYKSLPKEQVEVKSARDNTLYPRVKKAVLDDLERLKKLVGFDSDKLIDLTIGYERCKPEDEVDWVTVEEIAALLNLSEFEGRP